MRDEYPGKVPNYTNACVAMFGVNITWMLVAIWAIWGLLVAIALSWGVTRIIDRLPRWRRARRAAAIRRGTW